MTVFSWAVVYADGKRVTEKEQKYEAVDRGNASKLEVYCGDKIVASIPILRGLSFFFRQHGKIFINLVSGKYSFGDDRWAIAGLRRGNNAVKILVLYKDNVFGYDGPFNGAGVPLEWTCPIFMPEESVAKK